eukprot:TRINITY_DN5713_c0_g1_i1.p1 TRINITY_DN5713_c0_g1~~TRINITY_DN5713_c0_g1_i1.p1  ORF type:complete len:831 (-),score=81.24 TRINITY_DN5713_c0_g1_i1:204-2696(-)
MANPWGGDPKFSFPWFEHRNSEWHCRLCKRVATDEHIISDMHNRRASNPEYYGYATANQAETVPEHLKKPWFVFDNLEWHCRLCWTVATDEHINSDMHKHRASNPECYGYATANRAETVPEHLKQPWFVFENLEWHCRLCWRVATDEHINSDMHKHRASNPECYGYATKNRADAVPKHFEKPWFVYEQLEWHCRLCWRVATDEHINSDMHKHRASNPECYGYATTNRADAVPKHFEKPWFVYEQLEWHCRLCSKVATDEHINSDMHKHRASHPEHYGYSTATRAEPIPEHLNKPWFKYENLEWHCRLCSKVATDEHINSDMHKHRASHPEHYGYSTATRAEPIPEHLNKPWFKYENLEWHCRLCWKVATDEHINSDMHKHRASHPENYGHATSNPAEAVPEHLQQPWFAYKNLEWHCRLCWKVATDEHIQSDMHKRRASNPEWYGFGSAHGVKPCSDTHKKPWLVDKGTDNFFCLLCSAYADDAHLVTSKHTNRADNPGLFGFGGDVCCTRHSPDEQCSSVASTSPNLTTHSSIPPPSVTSVSAEDRRSASSAFGGSADAASRPASFRGRSTERGRSRSHIICLEETTDRQDLADSMRALQTAIVAASRTRNKQDWHLVWEAMRRMQRQRLCCEQCQADVDRHILAGIHKLEDVWWNHFEWDAALWNVESILQRELEAPEATLDVPIQDVRFTHSEASSVFSHGDDAGKHVNEVVEELVKGDRKTTDVRQILDVVRYHGVFYSLNNRHLKALKSYLEHVQPENNRCRELARVRLWPLARGLQFGPPGHDIIDKFCEAYDSHDSGKTLSLRPSRSQSRSRSKSRVRFAGGA